MDFIIFISRYSLWHYTEALRDFFNAWRNLIWFVFYFFSTSVLLRTLFSPWKKIHETYLKNLDLEELMGSLIVNTLMRVVGAAFKSFIILLSLVAFAFVLTAGSAALLVWLLFPLLVPALVAASLLMVFL